MTVRFIHLSDTHIAPAADFAKYGHYAVRNLNAVVDAINALSFPIDFVLHTGDVVDDELAESYRTAQPLLNRIRYPVYYASGNHDEAALLQREVLGLPEASPRYDHRFRVGGVDFAVFDTRGPNDPAGQLQPDQLAALGALCTPEGGPLVIVLHHPPVPLDSTWLDQGWEALGNHPMLITNWPDFWAAIRPARQRIRGVFFGHVHRAFQVVREGVLVCSAPSVLAQFYAYPGQLTPAAAPHDHPAFNLVTIDDDQTTVRQFSVAVNG